MPNPKTNEFFHADVFWAVNRAVDRAVAVSDAVYGAVDRAVYRTVGWAVGWAVAVAVEEDSNHPGLQDFLRKVGG